MNGLVADPLPSLLSTVVFLSQSLCAYPVELTDGGGGEGWTRSQIKRPPSKQKKHTLVKKLIEKTTFGNLVLGDAIPVEQHEL